MGLFATPHQDENRRLKAEYARLVAERQERQLAALRKAVRKIDREMERRRQCQAPCCVRRRADG